LPQFNLSEDPSEEAAQNATGEVLDNEDDTSSLLPDPEPYFSSDNEDDITNKIDKVNSRRRKAIEEENSNVQKKTSKFFNFNLFFIIFILHIVNLI
jgi:hypothetical protein